MNEGPKTSSPQWLKQKSTTRDQYFYFNTKTGESLWERPPGYVECQGKISRSESETSIERKIENRLNRDFRSYIYEDSGFNTKTDVRSNSAVTVPTTNTERTCPIGSQKKSVETSIERKIENRLNRDFRSYIYEDNGFNTKTDVRSNSAVTVQTTNTERTCPIGSQKKSVVTSSKQKIGNVFDRHSRKDIYEDNGLIIKTDERPNSNKLVTVKTTNTERTCPIGRQGTNLGANRQLANESVIPGGEKMAIPQLKNQNKVSTYGENILQNKSNKRQHESTKMRRPNETQMAENGIKRIKSTSPSYSNPKIDTTNRESVTLNGSPASTNIDLTSSAVKRLPNNVRCFTKTPIHDRFNLKKNELLKKQQNNCPESFPDENIVQPNLKRGISKTPMQDRFNKKREEFLQKNRIKTDTVILSPHKRETLHNDVHRRPITIQGDKAGIQNEVTNRTLKRAYTSNEGEDERIKTENTQSYKPNRKRAQFDLRNHLNIKRRNVSQNNNSDSSLSPMEWETTNLEVRRAEDSQMMVSPERSTGVEVAPAYQMVHLVCDTSALLDNVPFVEEILGKGFFLDLPLKIVIPFTVLNELDGLKEDHLREVSKKARTLNKMIQQNLSNKNLYCVEQEKMNERVGSFVPETNDDYILNCCLQIREACSPNELAVFVTGDVALNNKAATFKLQCFNWNLFKRWCRALREQKLTSKEEKVEKMEVDSDKAVLSSETTRYLTSSTDQLRNLIHSHLEDFQLELQDFLQSVLQKSIANEYGSLKDMMYLVTPRWKVKEFIKEVRKRWLTITGTQRPSSVENEILESITSTFNKHSYGKGDLDVVDTERLYFTCINLAKIFSQRLPDVVSSFLGKLKVLTIEWAEEKFKILSSQETNQEDLEPLEIALDNIYQCMVSDYEDLKNQDENNEYIFREMSQFHNQIECFEDALSRVLQETTNSLSLPCTNKNILGLYKLITSFTSVKGGPMEFELDLEHVLHVLKDTTNRKTIEQTRNQITEIRIKTDKLMSKINHS